MRSVLGALTAVLILGAAGTASAQTFLSPGALKDGTRGYIRPGRTNGAAGRRPLRLDRDDPALVRQRRHYSAIP